MAKRKEYTAPQCKRHHRVSWRVMGFALAAYDAVAIAAAYFLGLMLRFDFQYSKIQDYYLEAYKRFIPYYIVFCLALFWVLRLYRSIWRYAGFSELARILIASAISCVVHIFGIRFFLGNGTPLQRNFRMLPKRQRFKRWISCFSRKIRETAHWEKHFIPYSTD